MRIPDGFARHRERTPSGLLPGWVVRVGGKATFMRCQDIRRPGFVRKRLEALLGIRPAPDPEAVLVGKIRKSAAIVRSLKTRPRHEAGTADGRPDRGRPDRPRHPLQDQDRPGPIEDGQLICG